MKYFQLFFILMVVTTVPLWSFVNDPVQDYLSKRGSFPNEKLLEISTVVGPDNTDIILLSTINSPGQYIWSAYAKTNQGYEPLTNDQSPTNSIDFPPESVVLDQATNSIVYLVNGGGHHGALCSIQVIKGKLSVTTLALMGPGTDDPDWINYQKYFGAAKNQIPIKTIPFTELQKSYNSNTERTQRYTEAIPQKDMTNQGLSVPLPFRNPTPIQPVREPSVQAQPSADNSMWIYLMGTLGVVSVISVWLFWKKK